MLIHPLGECDKNPFAQPFHSLQVLFANLLAIANTLHDLQDLYLVNVQTFSICIWTCAHILDQALECACAGGWGWGLGQGR
jgi:hypothetical protein